MQLIYISSCASAEVFSAILRNTPDFHTPAQKFHRLVLLGLASGGRYSVHTVSYLPINGISAANVSAEIGDDEESGIRFHYIKADKGKALKILRDYAECRKKVSELYQDNNDTVVLCDALRPTTSMAALNACKKHHIPCIGILTDIPAVYIEQKRSFKQRAAGRIGRLLLSKYDGYIFLTEQMNKLINKSHKPYGVVEGLADVYMRGIENELAAKFSPRVCMYAGGLREVYGIGEMIRGFVAANIPDAELHIYGSGSFEKDVRQLCGKYSTVKFFGAVSNEEIVRREISATLLVNPRPANGEYTKYSFPSKNMEYMVSGTPMLGTRLAGMPNEYVSYMFLLDECSERGFKNAFSKALSMTPEKLHETGQKARDFVLREKNNVKMSEKISEVIGKVCDEYGISK